MRHDRLLRLRADADAVVEDRPAGLLVPVGEHRRRSSPWQVGDDRADQVARPRLVQPHAAGRQRLVVGDRDLDARRSALSSWRSADARSSCAGSSVLRSVTPRRISAIPSALARVVEDADAAAELLGLPERVPRVVELGRVEVAELVVAPADPGRVDGVGHAVARADVVERAVQLRPRRSAWRFGIRSKFSGWISLRPTSCERWSGEEKMTSNSSRPVESFVNASSSVSNVVTRTLTPSCLPNALMTAGFR